MKNLILLHGFLGSPKDFLDWSQSFSGFRVLPLHHSLKLQNFSLKNLAKNILEQIEHTGIQKAHFVGYSMGGRILLELYRLRPKIFETLCLLSTNLGLDNESLKKERVQKDQAWAKLLKENPDLFLEKWYSQELFKSLKKMPQFSKTLEERKKNLTPTHAQVLLEASQAVNPNHFDLVGHISVPLLAMVGEFDLKYRNLWDNLIAKWPNLELKVIPNSSHAVHVENPSETIKGIFEFVQKNSK